MTKKTEPATKQDVEDIASEIVAEVLDAVSERFDDFDRNLTSMREELSSQNREWLEASLARIENICVQL